MTSQPGFGHQARSTAARLGRVAADRASEFVTAASRPARQLVTSVRGHGEVAGLRHLPASGPALLVVNHSHPLDARALAAASPRPLRVVSVRALDADVRLLRGGGSPARSSAWRTALAELAGGGVVALFPEGDHAPDRSLHKGRDATGWLVLAAQVSVVPAVLDVRSSTLTLGPALDFGRHRGIPANRALARGVTDEIMATIADLGGLGYLDTFTTTARDQLRSAALKRRDAARARSAERRLAEQRALETRHAEAEAERRDLAQWHVEAEQAARDEARAAAERDQHRTGEARPGGSVQTP
ncbi:lysophospholipid acyltransferase family protein [Propionibacteriaceae bacterium G1746]|uniref:lysophospholipid acyltransferase family protein n=1 Tax=Aestuariimicrobium sp. G57 TaxID=3418485 RepID=UPI003C1BB10D